MKKALIASTALVLTAGFAAADVTISGYGRTGMIYYEDGRYGGDGVFPNGSVDEDSETEIVSRLRFNIDASMETDTGIEFGGRIRLQWDQGNSEANSGTPAYLYATTNGVTVYVGNVPTAFDENGLIYASELGAFDRSVGGNPLGYFYAFASYGYGEENDRVGLTAEYTLDNLTVRGTYIDPDQSGIGEYVYGKEEEYGLSVDYLWNDRLELSAAAVFNGAGFENNDQYFVGARYAVMDNARIGLNYYDNGHYIDVDDGISEEFGHTFVRDGKVHDYENGNTVTLYGDYTLADDRTNIEAYIANNSGEWFEKETDNAFGVGVNYDLGGARLGASLQRDYEEQVTADMGVRFDF